MLGGQRVFLKAKKSLGQCFLVNRGVAEAEAEHALGKRVLELGPGYGMLTRELCARAERVVAVEIDSNLFRLLKANIEAGNLKLINKDFFEADEKELELDSTDIMISNVPYKLSSKVIDFLIAHKLQAVLCLQKEFVDHKLAEPGTRKYSKLSVVSQLCFSMTRLIDVPKGNFRPMPKVDSKLVYMNPREGCVGREENAVIGAIMQHKKKTVRNAILDSHKAFGMSQKQLLPVAEKVGVKDSRLFKLSPTQILGVARELLPTVGSSLAPVSAEV